MSRFTRDFDQIFNRADKIANFRKAMTEARLENKRGATLATLSQIESHQRHRQQVINELKGKDHGCNTEQLLHHPRCSTSESKGEGDSSQTTG